MGAIADLVDVYRGYVDAITDTLRKAEAAVALENYEAAATAYQRIVTGQANNYSNTGGQVQKRDEEKARRTMDSAEGRLKSILGFDGSTLVDMGGAL